MSTIAGIRIPDSALARDAHELARALSPDFLLGHVERTYVFGAIATAGAGLAFDEEIAYIAAILHDLGLTERHGGQRRFEIDGAESARAWALSKGMSAGDAQRVWDAVALHASPGIAEHRSPECALVHWGAGIDVLGLGTDQLPAASIAEIHDAFPRDGFADGIADLIEAATRRSPAVYALTWLADTTNRCCGTSLPTFESLLRRDPFAMAAG
jgi:hypothetical protein